MIGSISVSRPPVVDKKGSTTTMALPQEKQATVENFKAWAAATQARRQALEAAIRDDARENVVRFTTREMRKGYSLDEAGDMFLKIARSAPRRPEAFIQAARETLAEMGWTPKRERA
ncbi:hypothetical protein ABIE53_001679 [Burkholderia sp. OAS925]|jgi:hypothetical protein|uniref:hypothetical protein n=1 Tax=Paraburkholderia TaxID=1822464 RepID=UPI0010506F04|nr:MULTISPECIES: hypothetical protein [Paraburkholderia]MDR6474429.1 hypothetical protein [Paraburkholderia graminis]